MRAGMLCIAIISQHVKTPACGPNLQRAKVAPHGGSSFIGGRPLGADIQGGTLNIALIGDYLGDTFIAAADGSGGTSVTALAPMGPGGSPQAFVAPMAQFGASAAITSHVGWPRSVAEPMLYLPGVMMA